MATKVAGEMYYDLDGQLAEIKRQLRQPAGYPFNPEALRKHLRAAIEGMFGGSKISIDRTTPFDPAKFIGKGWSIVEQDERSIALTEVDLTKVQFETCLKSGESSIKGEEKLERLKKDGRIRLDAKVFQTFWENQHLIPESWKEKINGNIRYIFFDGTILRGPRGDRDSLYLYWGGGEWDWGYGRLGFDWYDVDPSALLASI